MSGGDKFIKVNYEIKATDKWCIIEPFFVMYPFAIAEADEKLSDAGSVKEDFYGLTVGDIIGAIEGRIPAKLMREGVTVGEVCSLRQWLKEKLAELAVTLEATVPPDTPEQRRAASGLLDYSFEEAVLLTCQEFYGLHSLEDAQRLTMYEYLISRKKIYNERKFAININAIAGAGAHR